MIMKFFLLLYLLVAGIIVGNCTNNVVTNNEVENKDSVYRNSVKILVKLHRLYKAERLSGMYRTYPEYYGGMYINDENKLVVWVKKGFDIPEILKEEPSVIISKAAFSWRELKESMQAIDEFKSRPLLPPMAENTVRWFLDNESNRVIVRLRKCTPSDIKEFKKVVTDSPAIVFEQVNRVTEIDEVVNLVYSELKTRAAVMFSPPEASCEISTSDLLQNLAHSFLPVVYTDTALDLELFVYPNYYCGYYINKDRVVILVKEGDIDIYRQDLISRCKSANFEIQTRKYSMNEILEVEKKISNTDKMFIEQLKVCFWGMDSEKNTLIVALEDISVANINKFKFMVVDAPFLEFWKSNKVSFYKEKSEFGTLKK